MLLLQCMYQGLVLTMLGRDVILQFGGPVGVVFIAAMWMPTSIMSTLVTPHVLKNVAITKAVVEADHNVLDIMEKEFEQTGDYSAATQTLELMATQELSEEDVKHPD